MAPSCVKLWTRCLQDLQQLPAVNNDPGAVAVITIKVHAALAQWRELPPLSTRDWRKLVLEVKVPDMLFAVCGSAQQCAALQRGRLHGAPTAFTALHDFFDKGTLKGGFVLQNARNPNIAHSSLLSSISGALSLASGIRSQVLQTGLMEAFAAAMEAATDEHVRDPPHSYEPGVGTSQAAGAGQSDHHFETHCLLQHSMCLLECWHWVCELWPEGSERTAAIVVAAPAAVQLSAAIMQVVSRDLPAAITAAAAAAAAEAQAPQSRGSEDHAGPSGAVDSAESYTCDLFNAVYGVQQTFSWLPYCIIQGMDMPELRPVLAMPEFTTGLATMVVVLTQALLAQQWLGPTAAATSTHNTSSTAAGRSSGRSSKGGARGSSRPLLNSSSSPRAVSITLQGVMSSLLSTKMTRKLEAVLRNLPECTKGLLETLGMDSRAMVCAAAAQHKEASSVPLSAVATALTVIFEHQPVEDQRQQQLLFLVAATLLHWASNTRIKGLEHAQELAAIVACGNPYQPVVLKLPQAVSSAA